MLDESSDIIWFMKDTQKYQKSGIVFFVAGLILIAAGIIFFQVAFAEVSSQTSDIGISLIIFGAIFVVAAIAFLMYLIFLKYWK